MPVMPVHPDADGSGGEVRLEGTAKTRVEHREPGAPSGVALRLTERGFRASSDKFIKCSQMRFAVQGKCILSEYSDLYPDGGTSFVKMAPGGIADRTFRL